MFGDDYRSYCFGDESGYGDYYELSLSVDVDDKIWRLDSVDVAAILRNLSFEICFVRCSIEMTFGGFNRCFYTRSSRFSLSLLISAGEAGLMTLSFGGEFMDTIAKK